MQIAETQHQTPPRRTSYAFDSLAYAKRMESVGFTRQQAETMAEEQGKLIDERLATKDDIDLINANLEALRVSTKADIEKTVDRTKYEILKWMFGQTIVIIVAVIGILRAGLH